jgi:hypothetical protein
MYRFKFTITRPSAETKWPGEFDGDWNGLNYYRELDKILENDEVDNRIFWGIRHKIVGEDLEKIRIYTYDSHNETKLQDFHDKILDDTTIFNREIVFYEDRGFTVEVSDVYERQDLEIENADTY